MGISTSCHWCVWLIVRSGGSAITKRVKWLATNPYTRYRSLAEKSSACFRSSHCQSLCRALTQCGRWRVCSPLNFLALLNKHWGSSHSQTFSDGCPDAISKNQCRKRLHYSTSTNLGTDCWSKTDWSRVNRWISQWLRSICIRSPCRSQLAIRCLMAWGALWAGCRRTYCSCEPPRRVSNREQYSSSSAGWLALTGSKTFWRISLDCN